MNKDCSNCARDRFSIPCYDCLIGNNGVPSRWEEGENYVPESISLRAVQEVERRAKKNGTKVITELRKIGAYREILWTWKHNKSSVSSYYLQQMAIAGYDVMYILTGKRDGSWNDVKS